MVYADKCRQTNVSKFQYFGSTRVSNCNSELELQEAVTVRVSSYVRPLGVDMDPKLLFGEHVRRYGK